MADCNHLATAALVNCTEVTWTTCALGHVSWLAIRLPSSLYRLCKRKTNKKNNPVSRWKHPTAEFLQLLGAKTPLCSTLVNLTPHPPPIPPPLTYMPMHRCSPYMLRWINYKPVLETILKQILPNYISSCWEQKQIWVKTPGFDRRCLLLLALFFYVTACFDSLRSCWVISCAFLGFQSVVFFVLDFTVLVHLLRLKCRSV